MYIIINLTHLLFYLYVVCFYVHVQTCNSCNSCILSRQGFTCLNNFVTKTNIKNMSGTQFKNQ